MAFFNLGLQELIILAFMGLSCFGVVGVILLVVFLAGRGRKNDEDD
jgi:hypothetical protein